jgi:hypothetical protein
MLPQVSVICLISLLDFFHCFLVLFYCINLAIREFHGGFSLGGNIIFLCGTHPWSCSSYCHFIVPFRTMGCRKSNISTTNSHCNRVWCWKHGVHTRRFYSYGVLVLETVTGKRPTDSRFRQGLSIREYVDLALQKEVADAVDTRLSLDLENELHTGGDSSYKKKMDCVFSLLELGMSCTQELPSSRMPTGGIIKEMLAIKDSLLR